MAIPPAHGPPTVESQSRKKKKKKTKPLRWESKRMKARRRPGPATTSTHRCDGEPICGGRGPRTPLSPLRLASLCRTVMSHFALHPGRWVSAWLNQLIIQFASTGEPSQQAHTAPVPECPWTSQPLFLSWLRHRDAPMGHACTAAPSPTSSHHI